MLGIVFVYFIYYFGSKFIWIKGIGFGLAVWVTVFGTLLGETVQAKLPQSPAGIAVTITAHIMFGLALAGLTARFHLVKSGIANKKPKLLRYYPEPARKLVQSDNDIIIKKPVKIKRMKETV